MQNMIAGAPEPAQLEVMLRKGGRDIFPCRVTHFVEIGVEDLRVRIEFVRRAINCDQARIYLTLPNHYGVHSRWCHSCEVIIDAKVVRI